MMHSLFISLLFLHSFCFLLTSCHPHKHDDQSTHDKHDTERPMLSFTHWTDKTELFLEIPILIKGLESTAALHVTALEGFKPVTDGSVQVLLKEAISTSMERFESTHVTKPGIFKPIIKPAASGTRMMIIEIKTPAFTIEHHLGEVTIYDNIETALSAHAAESEEKNRITFLKEQQWLIEFDTHKTQKKLFQHSIPTTATIVPRMGGEVLVNAPSAGRIVSQGRSFPQLGTKVTVNELLGVIAPRLEAADVASLELAVTSATLEQKFALQEQQRLELLHKDGVISDKKLQEATRNTEIAQASLTSAQKRFEQYQRINQSALSGGGSLQLRAPITGSITEVLVTPGTFVEAGTPILRVTDLTQLWIEARIPAMDSTKILKPFGAYFILDGEQNFTELNEKHFAAQSRRIDPLSQTFPIYYALDNASGRYVLGTYAKMYLATDEGTLSLTIPESALLDDNGSWVVFVQHEGESFERRLVKPGRRDRAFVEILNGLEEGERVVSKGIWSVKLAASSNSVPAHGHAH